MQIRRILSILPILMVCHIIPVTAETLVDGGAVIYIKMNNQEGDISKSIMMCFGSCLFLVIATFALPGFFGIVRSDNVVFGW